MILERNDLRSLLEGPPTSALDPTAAAMVQRYDENRIAYRNSPTTRDGFGPLLPETARVVRQLASGQRVYAIKTSASGLCVLVSGAAIACGLPASQSDPTTAKEMNETSSSGALSPIAVGITRGGIRAVSFAADGQDTTVAVVGNIWIYEGRSNASRRVTAYYADGSVRVVEPSSISHGRSSGGPQTPAEGSAAE
ncbi:MAG: hypothetical protein H0X39_02365 [Actinobacteria bacterium]|nr:hypothetical protein [Actinomycetota bacterium]